MSQQLINPFNKPKNEYSSKNAWFTIIQWIKAYTVSWFTFNKGAALVKCLINDYNRIWWDLLSLMGKKSGYKRFTMRFTINNWKKRGIIDFQWDLLSLMGKNRVIIGLQWDLLSIIGKKGYNRFSMGFTIINGKKKWGYNATSLLGDL